MIVLPPKEGEKMGSGGSKDDVSPKRKEYPDYRPVKKYQVCIV